MELPDSAILSTFKNSQTKEQGFKMLMEKYQQRTYWQIRRMVIDHHDADDVLQDVWIKVWKNLGQFKEQSQLYTWLYRIAVNESLSFLKRKKRKLSTQIDEATQEITEKLKADEYFDADDVQMRLQTAIASLPDKQKVVFNLRYYDELTYDEISKVTGTSIGALKASYHHAAKKIENFFRDD